MNSIFEIIKKYQMIEPGMHVIAGVSGGADSVCLLYSLHCYQKKVPFQITVVHVEHGIRGEDSRQDAIFTEQLCQKLGIPCRVVSVNIPAIARELGMTEEEAGRMKRYEIMEMIRKECQADRIAVAHNQNDQAETVLHHLVRGSGLTGLRGIRPVRGRIIRPLLFTSRGKIEAILREAEISWRTDQTNLEQEYTRNRIRHIILPEMERSLNPQAVSHIAQAADHLRQVSEFVERMTMHAADACMIIEEGRIEIRLPVFFLQEELIQKELLRMALSRLGGLKDVGNVHIKALIDLCGGKSGRRISLPGGIRAEREYEKLLIRTKMDSNLNEKEMADLPLDLLSGGCWRIGNMRICVELTENSAQILDEIIHEKKYTKWLSYDTINRNVQLRTRQSGDYLIINQQGGKKKLKDYLIDQKISREKRDKLLLVAEGSHILWIPGYRISETAKVKEETVSIMKIRIEEDYYEGEGQNFTSGADC